MKTRFTPMLLALVVCCVVVFTGCAAQADKGKAAKKSEPATIDEALAADKPVFIYFYADRIADSKKDMDAVQKIADKNKALFVEVEAEENVDMRYNYAVEYVPTVIVLKPGVGIADVFVYEIPTDKIARSLEKDYKDPGRMADIKAAVKADKPSLLFFMADWCGYCQRVIPDVSKFEKEFGKQVQVITIDLDTLGRSDIIDRLYAVEGVPVMVALNEKGAVHRRLGYSGNTYGDFVQAFAEMGVKAPDKNKESGKKKSS